MEKGGQEGAARLNTCSGRRVLARGCLWGRSFINRCNTRHIWTYMSTHAFVQSREGEAAVSVFLSRSPPGSDFQTVCQSHGEHYKTQVAVVRGVTSSRRGNETNPQVVNETGGILSAHCAFETYLWLTFENATRKKCFLKCFFAVVLPPKSRFFIKTAPNKDSRNPVTSYSDKRPGAHEQTWQEATAMWKHTQLRVPVGYLDNEILSQSGASSWALRQVRSSREPEDSISGPAEMGPTCHMHCKDQLSHRGILSKVLLNAAPWVWLGSVLFSAQAYFPSVSRERASWLCVSALLALFVQKSSVFRQILGFQNTDGITDITWVTTGTWRTFFSLFSSNFPTSRELHQPDISRPNCCSNGCSEIC